MLLIVGANTYLSLEEANRYFAGQALAEAWEQATDRVRQQALLQACRHIEMLPVQGWVGTPCNAGQLLAWPRSLAGTDGIPPAVRQAQCEEALALVTAAGDTARLAATQDHQRGVHTSRSSSGAEVQYFAPGERAGGVLWSADARRLLQPFRLTMPTRVQGIW